MKLNHKIISIILIVSIFAFNLVLLPAQAEEGCHCDHPHGEGGFACFCGKSSLKPQCENKGPSLSKRHCGLDKKSNDFCIPAHEHPTLISAVGTNSIPQISELQSAESGAFYGADLLPIEHPPSIL